MFDAFEFSEESGESKVIVKQPVTALSSRKAAARSHSASEKANKPGSSEGETDGRALQLASALCNFWFAGVQFHRACKTTREMHTVTDYQPFPHDIRSTGKLSTQQKLYLKRRCIAVHEAVAENIMLLTAELSADTRSGPSNVGEKLIRRKDRSRSSKPQNDGRDQTIKKRQPRPVNSAGTSLDTQVGETVTTCPAPISERLQKDRHDIEQLFASETVCSRDVDILLFYSSLRAHAWNGR